MYVKIHEQIFSSSIMEEDVETRYIWFCLLTLADKEGFIDITIPAIARRINLKEEIVSNAIEKFMLPDKTSRTPDFEGRRLEKIRESFGWQVLNYVHYRDLRNDEARREYMRNYMKHSRSVNKKVNTKFTEVTCKHPLAHSYSYSESESKNTPICDLHDRVNNSKPTMHDELDFTVDKIPSGTLAELWNDTCIDLPRVRDYTNARARIEKKRLTERTLEDWKEVFTKISESPFCLGKTSKWKATYDWIMSNQGNAVKVLEGNYSLMQKKDEFRNAL